MINFRSDLLMIDVRAWLDRNDIKCDAAASYIQMPYSTVFGAIARRYTNSFKLIVRLCFLINKSPSDYIEICPSTTLPQPEQNTLGFRKAMLGLQRRTTKPQGQT